MHSRPLLLLAILAVLFSTSLSTSSAQVDDPVETVADESTATPVEQIATLTKAGKPAEAAAVLESALQNEPQDAQLRQLHQSIAMAYLRLRDYDNATAQLKQWFDFALPRTDTPQSAQTLASIVQQMGIYGARGDQAEALATVMDQAIARCRELEAEHPIAIQSALSRLISLRAPALVREGDQDASDALLAEQIEKLQAINNSDAANEETYSSAINLMTIVGRQSQDSDSDTKVAALFEKAMQAFPESEMLVSQYANNELLTISRLSMDDPESASQRLDAAIERLTPQAENFRSVKFVLSRIESLKSRIEAARKQVKMIGNPAPPLDIESWVNTESTNVDDLKGKVVLYDFWAVWCGPCIATFPHLREWREEFGEQGFEIVGVTRYYGYSWDQEAEKAVRSTDKVDPELEREAVTKFLQSHDMQHPTIFTPEGSNLQSEYAVTGIPHAVLVDRQGNVQMIKVGSGEANAESLHTKIKELIAQ